MATPTSLSQANPTYTPPAAESAKKDEGSMRIVMLALPIIAGLVGFVFLSVGKAIALAVVIAAGTLWYFRSSANEQATPDAKPTPASATGAKSQRPTMHIRVYDTPTADGEFANCGFSSVEYAKAFESDYFQNTSREHVELSTCGIDETNVVLSYKDGVDEGTKVDIAKKLRVLAKQIRGSVH